MKNAFTAIEKAAKRIDFQINHEKTKYMRIVQQNLLLRSETQNLSINAYNFEAVEEFIYL